MQKNIIKTNGFIDYYNNFMSKINCLGNFPSRWDYPNDIYFSYTNDYEKYRESLAVYFGRQCFDFFKINI